MGEAKRKSDKQKTEAEMNFLLTTTTMALMAVERRVNKYIEIGHCTKGNLQALRQIMDWSRECNVEQLQKELEREDLEESKIVLAK